jgi:hypothetical protein
MWPRDPYLTPQVHFRTYKGTTSPFGLKHLSVVGVNWGTGGPSTSLTTFDPKGLTTAHNAIIPATATTHSSIPGPFRSSAGGDVFGAYPGIGLWGPSGPFRPDQRRHQGWAAPRNLDSHILSHPGGGPSEPLGALRSSSGGNPFGAHPAGGPSGPFGALSGRTKYDTKDGPRQEIPNQIYRRPSHHKWSVSTCRKRAVGTHQARTSWRNQETCALHSATRYGFTHVLHSAKI